MTSQVSRTSQSAGDTQSPHEAPQHWQPAALKRLATSASGSGFPIQFQGFEYEALPFYKVNALARADSDGVIRFREDTISAATAKTLGAKVFPAGTLVLAKIGAALLLGRVRRLGSDACLDNNMLGIVPTEKVNAAFLHYALQNIDFSFLVNPGTIPTLNESTLMGQLRRWPPLPEQEAIADFLDLETAEIDTFIRDQEELIRLLEERRAATISEAVTKGLDPDVPMKSSGNDWIDEVPANWTVNRFSRCVRVVSGQVDPRSQRFIDMVLIAPNHVEAGTGRLIEMETAREQGADSGKYLVAKGQVIYSKIRPALSKVIIAPVACLCSADMYALDGAARDLTNEFIRWYLLGRPFTNYAIDQSARVAMPKLNQDTLGAAPICYPPLQEQQRICAFLEQETGEIDSAILDASEAIELLIERRASLISAAVTGKIDVRERVKGA